MLEVRNQKGVGEDTKGRVRGGGNTSRGPLTAQNTQQQNTVGDSRVEKG